MVALVALALAASCRLDGLDRDLRSGGDVGVVVVRVTVDDWSGAPLRVFLLRVPDDDHAPYRLVAFQTRERPGVFTASVAPGEYLVGAFVDDDADEQLDVDERADYTDPPVAVVRQGSTEVTLDVREPRDRSFVDERGLERLPSAAAGPVVAIDDERFGPAIAEEGVWRPYATAAAYPPVLALLEPHRPERTPVIFVHGMSGYAREFASLIARLDRSRFEPWVFQYPSGLRLSVVADALHRQLVKLRVRHGLDRACLVAHSMGGLVARGALRLRRGEPPLVRVLVTLASPLGGLRSAANGVRLAPVVVPAWRDLATGSAYLRRLHEPPLRPETELFLLAAYQGDGADDGVVPLASQLRREAQDEATRVRAYETTHVGILDDGAVAAEVAAALDRCRGDRPAEAHGPLVRASAPRG